MPPRGSPPAPRGGAGRAHRSRAELAARRGSREEEGEGGEAGRGGAELGRPPAAELARPLTVAAWSSAAHGGAERGSQVPPPAREGYGGPGMARGDGRRDGERESDGGRSGGREKRKKIK